MYPTGKDLKTGDVFLCRTPRSLEAWLIRKVLRSDYNHAAIVALVEGVPYIVEAMGGQQLSLIPFARWIAEREYEVLYLPGSLPVERVLAGCGKKYDYTSCQHHLWLRLTGKWYGAKTGKGEKTFYCFEYIAWLYQIPEWYKATPQLLITHLYGKVYA